jgi:hypothetical protein
MMHAPSTSKRSTYLPALCHFFTRPQLLTRWAPLSVESKHGHSLLDIRAE